MTVAELRERLGHYPGGMRVMVKCRDELDPLRVVSLDSDAMYTVALTAGRSRTETVALLRVEDL